MPLELINSEIQQTPEAKNKKSIRKAICSNILRDFSVMNGQQICRIRVEQQKDSEQLIR